MTFKEKIEELRTKIESALLPLIDNDYVLWDLSYHSNIGDTLIWQGELDFLDNLPYKCIEYASCNTCTFPKLALNTIILLHGGGNFGDLWRGFQEFRLRVIAAYPVNKIIMFPQTVFYEDKALMKEDAAKMALHQNLILCARDITSYNLLKENFSNQVLMLPDMAFCIEKKHLYRWKSSVKDKVLFLKRLDKEARNDMKLSDISEEELDIRDWPSIEKNTLIPYVLYKMLGLQFRLMKKNIRSKIYVSLVDWVAMNIFRPYLLKQGVKFVSSYRKIYSTRLHVVLLAILLHKEVWWLDNSYGKNFSFYNTWLSDLDKVKTMQ